MALDSVDRPDRFFTAEQIARLRDLMGRWRTWRDRAGPWSPEEQVEFQGLIEAELVGIIERTKAMMLDEPLPSPPCP